MQYHVYIVPVVLHWFRLVADMDGLFCSNYNNGASTIIQSGDSARTASLERVFQT